MKKITKRMSFPDICEAICDLEGYEEHLETILQKNRNPFERKNYQSELYETRKKLVKLRKLLNEVEVV